MHGLTKDWNKLPHLWGSTYLFHIVRALFRATCVRAWVCVNFNVILTNLPKGSAVISRILQMGETKHREFP